MSVYASKWDRPFEPGSLGKLDVMATGQHKPYNQETDQRYLINCGFIVKFVEAYMYLHISEYVCSDSSIYCFKTSLPHTICMLC